MVHPVSLDIPCDVRRSRSRSVVQIPVRPCHDLLASELKSQLTQFSVHQQVRSTKWPPVCVNHKVVVGARPDELAVPLGIFVDAAQYGGAAGAGRS
eukprot:6660243-Pyramimonas_sp.AAC.1